jgi:hypothetical protein
MNSALPNSTLCTLTKFLHYQSKINMSVQQGRSMAVATEAVAKGSIFLGAQKEINLSQNN